MPRVLCFLLAVILLAGCQQKESPRPEVRTRKVEAVSVMDVKEDAPARSEKFLHEFALTKTVLSKNNVVYDAKTQALKITSADAGTVTLPLFDHTLSGSEKRALAVQAQLLTHKEFKSQAFLELAARFSKGGPFVNRGIAIGSGSTAGKWVPMESPFYPRHGDGIPETVRVSVTLSGPGTVWVKDIRLLAVEKAR